MAQRLPDHNEWAIPIRLPSGVGTLLVVWSSLSQFKGRVDAANDDWRLLGVGPYVIAIRLVV